MIKRSLLLAILILSYFLFFGTGLPAFAEKDISIPIRVNIGNDIESINIVIRGRYRIFDLNSGKLLVKGKRLRSKVVASEGGITVADETIGSGGIRIVPSKDLTLYVNKRCYRGELDILKTHTLKLLVINRLDLEDYIKGVLCHEVSPRWPRKALRAQAIVARTFALYQRRQSKNRDFDLGSDSNSQVYGGRTSEKWRTNRAVRQTRHKVLTYKGEIFPTYYHATCAGHTERASNLWNIDLPPFRGVKCNFCKMSPHYKWSKEISLKELRRMLEGAGYRIESLVSIKIASRNVSGRVDKLEFKDSSGVVTLLTAKDFRSIVGPNFIRSTKFDVSVDGEYANFTGLGWGHGVGMCQWGAYGMARKGYKAEKILRYYYPGAEVSSVDQAVDEL